MAEGTLFRGSGRGLMYGAVLAAGAYAAYVGSTYWRYGHVRRSVGDQANELLDCFMPEFDVVERHQRHVAAPAEVAFEAACNVDLQQSALIRAIFKSRELLLGSRPDSFQRPRGLLALTKSLGWNVLAEIPGREVVVGAVTQPWKADVVFRGIPSAAFADFGEPDHVKIVWNVRADPAGANESVVRTETRVMATDRVARTKFRRYWSLFSPGIVLIRWVALQLTKADAERRMRERRSRHADRFDLVSVGDLDPEC